jgi:hypothetical protein
MGADRWGASQESPPPPHLLEIQKQKNKKIYIKHKTQVIYTLLVGTHIRTGHKHGRRKWKITQDEERVLFSNKCISA